MGFELNGVDFDMLLGAYVLNPSITKMNLKWWPLHSIIIN